MQSASCFDRTPASRNYTKPAMISPTRRAAVSLNPSLRSRLGAYSAGAVTGAFSIASSDAAIVYTSANEYITDATTNDPLFEVFPVDFNGDTITDLRLWTKDMTGTGTPGDNDALITGPVGVPGTVVGIVATGYNYVSRLNAGTIIDGSAALINLNDPPAGDTVGWMADSNGFSNSQWTEAPTNTGYVGVRFRIGQNTHYGWMRLTINPQGPAGTNPRAITLHEFAYESTPNAGIAAGVPEPTSLGLLALGSLGLAAHRRRRTD